jgi:hypothetical protein
MRDRSAPGTDAIGLPFLSCQINDISPDDNGGLWAVVTLALGGGQKTVRADYQRGKGPLPKVGERWNIDRAMGFWTFAATLEHYRTADKYAATSPDTTAGGGALTWNLPHGLGTKDVVASLRVTSTGVMTVAFPPTVVDADTVRYVLDARAAGYYTAVVIG